MMPPAQRTGIAERVACPDSLNKTRRVMAKTHRNRSVLRVIYYLFIAVALALVSSLVTSISGGQFGIVFTMSIVFSAIIESFRIFIFSRLRGKRTGRFE